MKLVNVGVSQERSGMDRSERLSRTTMNVSADARHWGPQRDDGEQMTDDVAS